MHTEHKAQRKSIVFFWLVSAARDSRPRGQPKEGCDLGLKELSAQGQRAATGIREPTCSPGFYGNEGQRQTGKLEAPGPRQPCFTSPPSSHSPLLRASKQGPWEQSSHAESRCLLFPPSISHLPGLGEGYGSGIPKLRRTSIASLLL